MSGERDLGRLAVALNYEAPRAPRVVAVGRGEFGARIIAKAKEHGVPLEENPALAEALAQVPVEEEIPEEMYLAVAQIIGFILRAAEGAEDARVAPEMGR